MPFSCSSQILEDAHQVLEADAAQVALGPFDGLWPGPRGAQRPKGDSAIVSTRSRMAGGSKTRCACASWPVAFPQVSACAQSAVRASVSARADVQFASQLRSSSWRMRLRAKALPALVESVAPGDTALAQVMFDRGAIDLE